MVDWIPNKKYIPGDIIKLNSIYYICILEHVSLIPPGVDFLSKMLNDEWLDIDQNFVNYIYPNKNLLFTQNKSKFRGHVTPGIPYNEGDILTSESEIFICIKDVNVVMDLNNNPNFIRINKEVFGNDNIFNSDVDSKSDPGPISSNFPLITITTENTGSMTTQTFTFDFFGNSIEKEDSESQKQRAKFKRKLGKMEDEVIQYNKNND